MAFEDKVALALMQEYVDRRAGDLAAAWGDISEADLDERLGGEIMGDEMTAISEYINQALISDKASSGAGAYLKRYGINLSIIRKELIKQTQKHIQKLNNKR